MIINYHTIIIINNNNFFLKSTGDFIIITLLLLLLLLSDMMNDIGIDKKQQLYIIKKMINVAIRATYYIFCCRNRNWDSPDLMQFCFVFFFVLFCFVLFFNNPVASSICKLPIRSDIYNCTFKNKNEVSIIIIVLIIRYRKIPKISPGAYIFRRPFSRGLFLEGLIYGGKFAFQNRLD